MGSGVGSCVGKAEGAMAGYAGELGPDVQETLGLFARARVSATTAAQHRRPTVVGRCALVVTSSPPTTHVACHKP